ncbi:MAG: SRPBCC family protein [Chitinophagaceae bacterium]|nr:SRPBCC family protein [Chitinophagaceae bacterium]
MIIVYILLGLIVTLLLVAALMPKSFSVEKNVVIRKPRTEVMSYVGNLNHYSQWNPWQKMDPTAKSQISGNPLSAGHQYHWEGKKIGIGELRFLSSDAHHIHFDLEFFKPWKSKAKDNWHFEDWGDGSETKVTWQNGGDLPWPMARLMGPMIAKNLNHQFEQGLDNLKKMVEGG